ncbi:Protein of unknown function [Gryllus bimaculatus]|nr:Protein of unknown function [Gryllus bimaculatus]
MQTRSAASERESVSAAVASAFAFAAAAAAAAAHVVVPVFFAFFVDVDIVVIALAVSVGIAVVIASVLDIFPAVYASVSASVSLWRKSLHRETSLQEYLRYWSSYLRLVETAPTELAGPVCKIRVRCPIVRSSFFATIRSGPAAPGPTS